MQVRNEKVTAKPQFDAEKIEPILKYMREFGIREPEKMLPSADCYNISFELAKSYTGFANAVRRVLMEELPVMCMNLNEKDLDTDDEYIISDQCIKNLNLVPIEQEMDPKQFEIYSIYLYKVNRTNRSIPVKASDITIASKDKGSNARVDIAELIPDSNVTICELKPDKYIKLNKIVIETGYCKDNAAKFSLLENIKYNILDMTPYDIHNKTGTRSIAYDPKEFRISFDTTGNISPGYVIKLLIGEIVANLESMSEQIETYKKNIKHETYYYDERLTVEIQESGMYIFKFNDAYITYANMVAQRCYINEQNIKYCSGTYARLDQNVGIIKILGESAVDILISAIADCIVDAKKLRSVAT